MEHASASRGLPFVFGGAHHGLAFRRRRMLGGGLPGVRHTHDRVARTRVAGRRTRADPPGEAVRRRRRPVSPGLLDRRGTPPDPRTLARPCPAVRRVLRPQPNPAVGATARGLAPEGKHAQDPGVEDAVTDVQFGIALSTAARPGDDPAANARHIEELGFDLLSVSDHLPGSFPTFETWTVLTWAAAATSRVKLMTGVLGLPYRPPPVIAKMAQSLDRLSGGRLILGLGGGG